jgi:FtsZ-interacting cell division protein ZipA
MNTLTIILIVIAVAAVVVAAVMYVQRERTRHLRTRFGPEYDRLVQEGRNPRKAEEELLQRQKRVERFHIRELDRAESDRYSESWRAVQARFVDAPKEAVGQADRLVRDVMTTRGYPMGNFEQSAADISVDHPRVVQNYRAAHDLASRDAAGKATTEDLRQAMVHYRALFEDLLTTVHAHDAEEVRR